MRFLTYIFLTAMLLFGVLNTVRAQHFDFSDDPEKFHLEVFEGLQRIEVEAVRKIASDFRDNWPRMTAEQKQMIIKNAQIMRKRRLPTRPFFTYYFGYITYAVEQAGLPGEQLTKLLDINTKLIKTYSNRDLLRFYTDMNFLMGRSSLYRHHYNSLKFSGGSYEFEYIEPMGGGDSFEDPIADDFAEDTTPEDEFLTDDDFADDQQDDTWGDDTWGDNDTDNNADDSWDNPDSWGNDDWNNTDSWGNDTWSDTDTWGDTDSWGNDTQQDDSWGDGWGNNEDPWAEDQQQSQTTWTAEQEADIFDGDFPDLQKVKVDVMASLRAEEQRPPIQGPVIHFKNIDLEMASIYDSIGIENATGTYLINERIFIGESGKVKWPGEIPGTDGAYALLEDYYFKGNIPYVRAIQSKLVFSEFFEGEVDGFFLFKTVRRDKRKPPMYPRFKSHHANVDLKIPAKRLTYHGGISLNGGQMTGENVAGENSRIEVLDGKGRSFVALSPVFVFGDSVITAAETDITIYHGEDSIHHPKVRFKYDYGREILTLVEPDNGFKYMPYFSSFFEMDMNVDLVKWDLTADSINFSIMNGSNLVPAIFESHDYFHHNRIEQFTGLYRFNPVVAVVNYARKVKSVQYYVAELADFYKTDLNVMKSAMKTLSHYGLIKFEPVTGEIIVTPKANHYYLSNLEKSDFDHLLVSSTFESLPNATFRIDSGQLQVRGVQRVLLTHNQEVYLEPDSTGLTILEDRDIKFNGLVWSGDFEYKGKDFTFDYDEFLMDLEQIDSIRIEIPIDSTMETTMGNRETHEEGKTAMHNHLTNTSGVLYINRPDNRSGVEEIMKYPYFVSEKEATVGFSSPEILGGAYDSTFRFEIPPFEVDSLDRGDLSHISFEGTFNAGGIIEPIDEKLRIMPDRSFGFEHKIPEEGYNLYGGEGKIFNDLRLDNKGLRADGRIEHLTTELHSEDFIFYPDSVSTVGIGGKLDPGTKGPGSFPQADFGKYKMRWLPKKDSMYIANLEEPINLYSQTATLDGEMNVTSGGVYGEGLLSTRGSEIESLDMTLAETSLSANHADFKVLTDDPEKPAMLGEDVAINFDLDKNIADIHPENIGVAAMSFPYAQMKTSITDALWDLNDSTITMTKPANVPIEDSYFFTTRPELDSLAFNATSAVYDINTKKLDIEGIPYIIVADARITPEGGKTTILENAELEPFTNATIVIDTLNGYHRLYDADIKILSRNRFVGKATYQLVNAANDSFAIEFEEFRLEQVQRGKKETKLMTVSGGEITEENDVIISPGFQYRGRVTMYADQQALDMKGYVQPIFPNRPDYDYWIQYTHEAESPEVEINYNTALTESGQRINAGLFLSQKSGELYMAFLENPRASNDVKVFEPSGSLKYLLEAKSFSIEDPLKSTGESYAGRTMIYSPFTHNLLFEGPMSLTQSNDNFSMQVSALGEGDVDSAAFKIDAMISIDMKISEEEHDAMVFDVMDIIERLGAPVANTADANELYKLANLTNEAIAKGYEKKALRNYTPLVSADELLEKTIMISHVDLNYSQDYSAWYNTSQIGLSNMYDNDINAMIDGFMEIKKDNFGDDVVNLFLQIAPGTWYYFNYEGGRLLMFSSNNEFNAVVEANSNVNNVGFGQYATVKGDLSETLKFINNFREKYFGITEPYDLQSPDEIFLDDEKFDTIEKDKDGFGF